MALNKRKVLEAARKFSQKGAKAKALKEYNKLLAADPRDPKLLLEVGDAYRRWGQPEEAIAQYGKVAQQYRQDGFEARAVAVFKQMLNLDPKLYSAYVSLSELYQGMGLEAEAITALQTAADGYQQEGRKAEALDLLRRTAALDPTNTTSRLKVAELLRQEGMEAEALSEYRAIAEELNAQQDRDQLVTIQERILEIKPDEVETLSSLVRNLMAAGDLVRAESFAVRALNASPEPVQCELLIELYAQGGEEAKLADATRSLAKLYRERGDDEKARELMQRLPVEETGSRPRIGVDVSEVAEPDLGDEELLHEEPFPSTENETEGESGATDDDLDLDMETPATPPPESQEPAPIPDGDPDQLLAEANVYLRYGKRDQAIANLRGVIAQDPKHRAALEKLGEAYADGGQTSEAVDAWKRAAIQVREAGDEVALAVLKDRIAALDPAAAEQIDSVDPAKSNSSEASLDLDFELDLDLDQSIDEVSSSQTEPGLDFETGGDDFEIEIDDEPIDVEPDPKSARPEEQRRDVEATTPDFAADASSEPGLEIEDVGGGASATETATETETAAAADEEPTTEFDFDVDDIKDASTGSPTGQSTTTAAKVSEELEEAEFYIAQDMLDEAEEILTRVLEMVPNHPSAMLRMGEVAAARGSQPDGGSATAETDVELFDGDGDGGDDDDAVTQSSMESEASPEVVAKSSDASATQEGDTVPTETIASGKQVEEESFDLREALADILTDDEDGPGASSTSNVRSTVEDGFDSIFSDFKKGVSEALGDGDYETRYDLGIAYREMGLYEDAIGEFRICLDSPTRHFDSLYLMGICARELSRFDDSVNHFEQALALPDIPAERFAGVYFDLSIAQEGLGEIERALSSVQKVIEIEAGFPGASERLADLEAGATTSPKLGEPGEGFESFEDLFEDDDDDEGGDVAMAEAVPVETYESFDDLIEEAEAAVDREQARTDSDPDDQSARKTGRNKISFV